MSAIFIELVNILSQAEKKVLPSTDVGATLRNGLREAALLICGAVALFFLIALLTFDLEDAGWSHTGAGKHIANSAGAFGAWLADFSFSMIGATAYLLPFLLAVFGHALYRARSLAALAHPVALALRACGLLAALIVVSALADIHWLRPPVALPESGGGIVGEAIGDWLLTAFGRSGASILLGAGLLAGISLYTGLSWLGLMDAMGRIVLLVSNGFFSVFRSIGENVEAETPPALEARPAKKEKSKPARAAPTSKPAPEEKPQAAQAEKAQQSLAVKKIKATDLSLIQTGELPPLDLLNQKTGKVKGYTREALDAMSRLLESILADFGVEAEVTDVHPGPVITRFEVQPAPGVKASRVSGLAKDLARALTVTSVRVVEIIPGKTVIGLEIPNEEREMVLLHAVLSSDLYRNSDSPLTMVLGKDIAGAPVVANLAKMPHLLVAGTTGSGKSVAVNVMILSMLFKATPDDVRMIMIDPKMLELSIYEGIPHLLTPVVTDMKEAANALRWSVAEMERRYKLMSLLGVRNLAGFNQKVRAAIEAGEPIPDPMRNPAMAVSADEDPPPLAPLPFIVIIIDELADMMMIVGKKVEELIARLAQKARAAGIHLILATQRPSVDVLTGLIKANIPTRLSFQVSSRIDSRTIIDQGGAEALLGNGDMLFLPPGSGLPMRAHGAFVSDQEVHNVVEFLKRTGKPNYIEAITRFTEDGADAYGGFKGAGGSEGGEESDPLYDEAVRFVVDSRKASISSLQRQLKVGYNRAARMIEDMEKAGVVSPAETNGSRTVLAPPTDVS
jgi:S-DNA-T family DNA segregation ATPase FtsK/SpoIIIE